MFTSVLPMQTYLENARRAGLMVKQRARAASARKGNQALLSQTGERELKRLAREWHFPENKKAQP